ncbi:MAG: tRNA (N6-threonylcarbamoyladenosine(37)-N6)-methyltransferase TrmO [Coriobacteriia bacterium]|nr:tRNA (N6-threonylcarbamoyladenosine(37)-N6)-methyltransferase TrmO [Coriobacteriia bacterium]
MKPIAHIHTDYHQKFGIPRNAGLAADTQGVIIFEPGFANPEAVRGLQEFSHLWLIWQFENTDRDHWRPTVRPPRLGGSRRMGVFATRSPFRPNPLGLSCVRLDKVEVVDGVPFVHVLGADLRDNTPILDIKPYLPFADCHPEANGGWTDDEPWQPLKVDFPASELAKVQEEKQAGLIEALAQDPRPPLQNNPEKSYAMAFAGYNIRFTVDEPTLHVTLVEPLDKGTFGFDL